jgi:hypothetical protein
MKQCRLHKGGAGGKIRSEEGGVQPQGRLPRRQAHDQILVQERMLGDGTARVKSWPAVEPGGPTPSRGCQGISIRRGGVGCGLNLSGSATRGVTSLQKGR